MASLRALRPLARQAPRLLARPATMPTKRFLNTATAPVIFTSHATVTGARAEGHIKGDHLQLELDMPTALGGAGKHANPEELFAAGYGACFQGAMGVAAGKVGVKLPQKVEDFAIETDVHLVGSMTDVDLGIRVDMKVKAKGVKKEDLEKVIEKTKEICPYSRATKGNVTTNVEAVPT